MAASSDILLGGGGVRDAEAKASMSSAIDVVGGRVRMTANAIVVAVFPETRGGLRSIDGDEGIHAFDVAANRRFIAK